MLNWLGIGLIVLGVAIWVADRFFREDEGSGPNPGWKKPLAFLALGTLLLLLVNSFVVVPAGHVGVVFNILRGVQDRPLYEGVHFVVPGL
jgi:hypothetical protein